MRFHRTKSGLATRSHRPQRAGVGLIWRRLARRTLIMHNRVQKLFSSFRTSLAYISPPSFIPLICFFLCISILFGLGPLIQSIWIGLSEGLQFSGAVSPYLRIWLDAWVSFGLPCALIFCLLLSRCRNHRIESFILSYIFTLFIVDAFWYLYADTLSEFGESVIPNIVGGATGGVLTYFIFDLFLPQTKQTSNVTRKNSPRIALSLQRTGIFVRGLSP